MPTLRQARCTFTLAIASLLLEAAALGYEVALDEGKVGYDHSIHMKGSLHESGLAQDILLYKDGTYLTDTADYTPLGIWWEAYGLQHDLPLAWGGRFTKADGNHFSYAWEGKK